MEVDKRGEQMYDLAVIGGGPAGTSAAITAAAYGAAVVLFDKGSFPRNKVCGEFVSAESLQLLSSLLPECSDLLRRAPRIDRARVFIDGRVLETPVHPAAASITRIDLDLALWTAARNIGVHARESQSVSSIAGNGPFAIRTEQGEFSARSIIDASGRWSNLTQQESRHDSRAGKWLGLKAHYSENAPPDSVDLYFFEGGYCGVQPVESNGKSRINACAMIRSDVGKSLEEVFEQHVELKKRSRGWQQLTPFVATSPLLFHSPQPLQGGILQVGDAAGFVDPFVGDGISLALRSGALAANSLSRFLSNEITLQQAAELYQDSYREDLSRVYNVSSKIRRLISLPPLIRTMILAILGSVPALTRYMVRKTR
jgi:menaquinone-9 beta-reductase